MVTVTIKHKDGSATSVLLDDDSPYLNRPFYLSRGYVQMRHNGKRQYLHRVVLGLDPSDGRLEQTQ